MSNQKAADYDQLVREHTAIQNAMNRVPQLSIEEQSKVVDINERYSTENQKKVNQLQSQLFQVEQQLQNLF
jgi:hypothetical protein|tara:strand:+ start:2482 stop:2694 length:213 start_codon:yes stop_codon:yes gene_type:complete